MQRHAVFRTLAVAAVIVAAVVMMNIYTVNLQASCLMKDTSGKTFHEAYNRQAGVSAGLVIYLSEASSSKPDRCLVYSPGHMKNPPSFVSVSSFINRLFKVIRRILSAISKLF